MAGKLIRLKRYKSDKEPRYSYMTKYDIARALGMRSQQIATDPKKPCISRINQETLSYDLASLELYRDNILPIVIRREYENGECEDWVLDDDQTTYKDCE